jgi:hypothetical protein
MALQPRTKTSVLRRETESSQTRRWREVDSNHRFLVGRSNRDGRPAWLSRKGSGSVGEPKVRIHLPPAASQERTPPARSLAHSTFAELMSNGHLVQTGGRRWRRYETSAIASAYPRAPSTDIGWIAASLRSTGWFTASLSKGSIACVVDGPFREFPESAG